MDLTLLQGVYCGPAPGPDGVWARWNFDPFVLVALLVLTMLVWRKPMAFVGVGVLAIIFISPLCALSSALFSARVVHHVLLVAVAAPLLATALRDSARAPVLPLVAATFVLWVWHLPAAYDLALGHIAIYWVMQVTLLGSAIVFWASVLSRSQAPGTALLATLAAYVQMALLGALLTFAPESLYVIHATAPLAFGLTPLADQQLGGLIMWVPASLPFLVIGGILAQRHWRAVGGFA